MSEVLYISPVAFLRSMAAIAWSAISDPFRTTVIDLSSGRRVAKIDVANINGQSPHLTGRVRKQRPMGRAQRRKEFTKTYRTAMAKYRSAVTKINGKPGQLTVDEYNELRRICLSAMAEYRRLGARTPLDRLHWRRIRQIERFLNSHSSGQLESRRYQSPAGE